MSERSLADVLAPSAITNVVCDGWQVKVLLRVETDPSPDRVRVSVRRNIEGEWEVPEVTWSGVARSDMAYAEAFVDTLRQAVAIAQVLMRVMESPNGPVLDMDERQANPGGWQQIQRGLIWHMSDYALCLWMMMHGGQPFYSRGQRTNESTVEALREEAFLIATGIEVT